MAADRVRILRRCRVADGDDLAGHEAPEGPPALRDVRRIPLVGALIVVMGFSHGLSGLAAGFGYGAMVTDDLILQGVCGGVGFLFAYLPDLDHLRSTVTRLVPIIGPLLSRILRFASRRVYALTKGPRDEDCAGDHRHLSHTLLFALAVGAGVRFLLPVAASAAGVTIPDVEHVALVVGVAAALGCFVHCLGDALTVSGCPFLWPLPILGETWYELRPPRLLRFRTGKVFEKRIMVPLLVVAVALTFPGAWPLLMDARQMAEAMR